MDTDLQLKNDHRTQYYKDLNGENDDFLKTVSAFANSNGGRIVFGVNETGIQGNHLYKWNLKKTLDGITNLLKENVKYYLNEKLVFKENKFDHLSNKYSISEVYVPLEKKNIQVLILEISKIFHEKYKYTCAVKVKKHNNSPKKKFFKYYRNDTLNTKMSSKDYNKIFHQNINGLDLASRNRESQHTNINNFHFSESEQEFYSDFYKKMKDQISGNISFLWGDIQYDQGTDIDFDFMPNYNNLSIKYQKNLPNGKDYIEQIITGTIKSQIEDVRDLIFNTQDYLNKKTPPMIKLILEEILINGIAHRDYSIDRSIKIELYKIVNNTQKIEITIPGSVYHDLDFNRFRLSTKKYHRNPTIYQFINDYYEFKKWKKETISSIYKLIKNKEDIDISFREMHYKLKVSLKYSLIKIRKTKKVIRINHIISYCRSAYKSRNEIDNFLGQLGLSVKKSTLQGNLNELVSKTLLIADGDIHSKNRKYTAI